MEDARKLVHQWLDSFAEEKEDINTLIDLNSKPACNELTNALIVFLEEPEYYEEVSLFL